MLLAVVDWLVASSGLVSWALFYPQGKLLVKRKNSDSLSLASAWGSWVLQLLILIQAWLRENWALVFTMAMSVVCLGVVIFLIHYYRYYPGGKQKSSDGPR